MKTSSRLSLVLLLTIYSFAGTVGQTNMFIDNPLALEILKSNYNPEDYRPASLMKDYDQVIQSIVNDVDPEIILEALEHLDTFYNRNTGSDTTSLYTGIGAARSWIKYNFDMVSKENDSRLITGYLEFDANVCGMGHHKNPFIILPGMDTSRHDILVVEGHFDTRNEDGCDTEGYTPGIDDNGSGTVLVMEAARVMSRFAFDRTILFTTPTGEDQGLWGATAWADFLKDEGIEVLACLNNDVVGGIYCGKTSSPPSCPYWGHVDSTHVRIFSYGSLTRDSPHKSLARYIKMIQEEKVNPYMDVQQFIDIMSSEDRTGRSGDHIPFRRNGYPAIRYCSANEHGNGAGTYPDRQHSTRDVLGVDVDDDGVYDTLYVDPNYLARNTISNASVLASLANSPGKLTCNYSPRQAGIKISFDQDYTDYDGFMVGIRYNKSHSHEFDRLSYFDSAQELSVDLGEMDKFYVSVAPVKDGYTGVFSEEYLVNLLGTGPLFYQSGISIMNNMPNPWNEQTKIIIDNHPGTGNEQGNFVVQDISGRVVLSKNINLKPGENELQIKGDELLAGVYFYSLRQGNVSSVPLKMVKIR
jgi:hypothetical protein